MSGDTTGSGGLAEVAEARDDVEAILLDVLTGVLGEEAEPVLEELPGGVTVAAVLAIRDEELGEHAVVEVRVGEALARVLAGRMMFVADPEADDVLDAVAELGNICAGQVKTLLTAHARLSLPSADTTSDERPGFAPGGVQVRAVVLGQIVELAVTPGGDPGGLLWPPSTHDDALERQS